MISITLADNSQRQFDHPPSVLQVAENISPRLAKATLAGIVNDTLVDSTYCIESDANVKIITAKDAEGLEILRHSCAHLLAMAVKSLFPKAQVTIGPVINDGFYYDFAFERSFTPEDLEKIEVKMHELAKANIPVKRLELSRDAAIEQFKSMEEHYKVMIIEDIPANEILSCYQQDDFIDLCRGPHIPHTGHLTAFKLTKVAGAYWRGDANNAMLQRIYGTCWPDKKQLQIYLTRLEEAEKRDHRRLAKQLNLFHTQEEAPGMVFWHPNGWTLYQIIEQYIRNVLNQHDYLEIKTPQVVDRSLWEKSGHWDKFSENMFTTASENRDYAIKPMNCPCHVQVYNQGLKSYRDLPLKLAEFGSCHRNEPSGTLHGLMRVRQFTQDDAHIFCTEDQIQSEVSQFIDLVFKVYNDFGFKDILIKLSTRPEKRVGSDEIWDKSEKALELALNNKGLDWELLPGEGAFYGPKIEFSLLDCLHRVWQCGTIQVDFSMPERLDAFFVAEDGSKKTPVMLHRAVLGSLERFVGVLIEHYAGKLPLWLAPIQIVVANITDKQREFCQEIVAELKQKGFRVISDLRNEKIGFKIREHTVQKIPYLLVVGDKEVSSNTVSVRALVQEGGKQLGSLSLDAFCKELLHEIKTNDN